MIWGNVIFLVKYNYILRMCSRVSGKMPNRLNVGELINKIQFQPKKISTPTSALHHTELHCSALF